jgi:hypothetical protein
MREGIRKSGSAAAEPNGLCIPDIGQARHPAGAPAPPRTGAMARASRELNQNSNRRIGWSNNIGRCHRPPTGAGRAYFDAVCRVGLRIL